MNKPNVFLRILTIKKKKKGSKFLLYKRPWCLLESLPRMQKFVVRISAATVDKTSIKSITAKRLATSVSVTGPQK